MSATPADRGVHPDPKQRDDAAAKMAAASKKEFKDLPADHPMALRQSVLDQIEDAHLKSEGVDPAQFKVIDRDPEKGGVTATDLEGADIKAPDISQFTDKPSPQAKPAEPAKTDKTEGQDKATQVTEEPIILTAEDLKKYKVKSIVDGQEQVVDATKALGQYQKGAAADVRLANATKLERDAKALVEKAQKDAQQAVSTAATPSAVADAKTQVQIADAAKSKFKEASTALFEGNEDKAAQLFSEAVAVAVTPLSEVRRSDPAIDTDALVSRVSTQVEQKLSEKRALNQLFADYPQVQKRAFGIVADEYINAFVSEGMSVADAIAKAGETLAEEYGWTKTGAKAPEPVRDTGRPIKTTGPTTVAEKADAKKGLDNVTSAHTRSAGEGEAEETPASVIQQMANARPGARVV